jgi:hypothetical protein
MGRGCPKRCPAAGEVNQVVNSRDEGLGFGDLASDVAELGKKLAEVEREPFLVLRLVLVVKAVQLGLGFGQRFASLLVVAPRAIAKRTAIDVD